MISSHISSSMSRAQRKAEDDRKFSGKMENIDGELCKKLAPQDGLEPPTRWLTATCSTN